MTRRTGKDLTSLSSEEFDLSDLEADLSAKERALQARLRAVEDRRRVMAEREALLRSRAEELARMAASVGTAVHSEVQEAATSRGLESPQEEAALLERKAALRARQTAARKRTEALSAFEAALANLEKGMVEIEATLGHRETSVAALAREVIRLEGEHRARREAQARAMAEEARRAAEARAAGKRASEAAASAGQRPAPAIPPPPPNRRVYPRYRVELDVTLHSEHNFFTGFTENLSQGGLFIATHEYLPIGTELDLTFRLPNSREIRTRGRVRWIREYNPENVGAVPGMGVKFLELRPDDLALVSAFFREREPMFFA